MPAPINMKSELINFITSSTHLKTDEIKPELKLAEDIGLYGQEAIGFFEAFFKTFEIRNLDEFDAELYIDGSVDFAPRPINWIKNVLIKERRKYLKPDVTLGHLNKVVEFGKWTNEK